MNDRRASEAPRRGEAERAMLTDPALAEALAAFSAERLSNEDVRQMHLSRRRTLAALGAAGLAAAGFWSGGYFADGPVEAAYHETRRGEQREVRLPDGSRLRLNGATRLVVRLEADRRHVRLERGQAFFDIAHDARRPFEVLAGEASVRVLGTAFDVDLEMGGVKLAVHRGQVRFGRSTSDEGAMLVGAGWRARFDNGAAHAPTRFDPGRQDWRDGWLDVDTMPIEELVEALNRQAGPPILPPPRALGGVAIAGRFRLDDPRGLLEAIGAGYGFTVRREGAALRLVPAQTVS